MKKNSESARIRFRTRPRANKKAKLSRKEIKNKMRNSLESELQEALKNSGFEWSGSDWVNKEDIHISLNWKKGLMIGQMPNSYPSAFKLDTVMRKTMKFDKKIGKPLIHRKRLAKIIDDFVDEIISVTTAFRKYKEDKRKKRENASASEPQTFINFYMKEKASKAAKTANSGASFMEAIANAAGR